LGTREIRYKTVMSYSVHVFPRATQTAYEAAASPAFFEDEERLPRFAKEPLARLVEHLELVGFEERKSKEGNRHFVNEDWAASALLTKHGLYLSATGDGVFEILQLGSGMADDDLAKYDPQEDTWE